VVATNPRLTRGGVNFSTSLSTTLHLYNANSESPVKSANLINIPIPISDSSGTIVFDLLGVTREVRIRGRFAVSGSLTIEKFTQDLNSLVDGNQGDTGGGQVGYIFNPVSISGTFTVYVNDVNWEFRAGEPNTLDYSLTLFEADGSTSG